MLTSRKVPETIILSFGVSSPCMETRALPRVLGASTAACSFTSSAAVISFRPGYWAVLSIGGYAGCLEKNLGKVGSKIRRDLPGRPDHLSRRFGFLSGRAFCRPVKS